MATWTFNRHPCKPYISSLCLHASGYSVHLMSNGSSWSSSCWSVYRPQLNTQCLAHTLSMSVYVRRVCTSELNHMEPRGWALEKWKSGSRRAAGAWGGALESKDLRLKLQLCTQNKKRNGSGPVSPVWSLWIPFLPGVRGHTLRQQ